MHKLLTLLILSLFFLDGCGSTPITTTADNDSSSDSDSDGGSDNDGGSTGGGSTGGTTTGSFVSFSSNIQPIFNNQCATSGCHTGTSPAGSLDLTSGSAYSNIVNVSATNSTGTLVVPSSSSSSILYLRINGTTSGSQMPTGSAALSSTDQSTIATWIDNGASNN